MYFYHVVTDQLMTPGQQIIFDDSHCSGVYRRVHALKDTVAAIYRTPDRSSKLGRRHKAFLRKHRPLLFNELLLTGELSKDLVQVNEEATERLESLIEGVEVEQGITGELKARDSMAWVGVK